MADLPVTDAPREGAVGEIWFGRHWNGRAFLDVYPPLFDLSDGRYFFDGFSRIAVPHLGKAAIGLYPRWFRWDDRIWLLTLEGWYGLQPDLSLRRIDAPFAGLQGHTAELRLAESALFGRLVFVDDGVWLTRDGETFETLLPAGSGLREYVSDIPNRPSGLVLGQEDLFLITKQCNGD